MIGLFTSSHNTIENRHMRSDSRFAEASGNAGFMNSPPRGDHFDVLNLLCTGAECS